MRIVRRNHMADGSMIQKKCHTAGMTFQVQQTFDLKIKTHDWPRYTEEGLEIYEQAMLDKFFAAYDAHELLLFEFFMVPGIREQEVIYATDNGVNLKTAR
jgi:hypothetical protein